MGELFEGYLQDQVEILKAKIVRLEAQIEHLKDELFNISAFAVGNGDVCEVIARRARKAAQQ